MAADEGRGLRVRERHRELVQPLVERHRGEQIEMRGDECLVVFHSALEAVRCGLAILDAVEEEPDLDLHVGIHVGDIVRVGAEISGDGVNLARRLCALSEGGGLCTSAEVRQAVRNHPDVEALALGPRELKGIGRPVDVYALGRPGRVRPLRSRILRAHCVASGYLRRRCSLAQRCSLHGFALEGRAPARVNRSARSPYFRWRS